ncbi:unnamed protein product [Menidia menidia]|uniref:(Atlantic silverside) hypothetical protein n=1 Tax=Menidia menidia TaxID=238744 RepID=A0A8S4BEI7_9TELE|nr:unnamed protein product [Menidia menidia]
MQRELESLTSAKPPPPPLPSASSGPQPPIPGSPGDGAVGQEPPRQRENFNVMEIRHPFNVTAPSRGNLAVFHASVMHSNAELPANNNLELIFQVVRNPSGGVKRKLEKTLDCELINEKKRHSYLPGACLTDREASVQGKQWQLMEGLTEQTPVNFSDVNKLERIVKMKIVVFYRKGEKHLLCKFETDFPDRSNPLFLFLLGNHYYEIRNLTGFTGAKYTCSYCYIGFDHPERHLFKGYCPICHDPSCHLRPLRSVQCSLASHPGWKSLGVIAKPVNSAWSVKDFITCPPLKNVSFTNARPSPLRGDFESFSNQSGVLVPFLVCTKTLKGVVWYAYGLDCVKQFLLHFRSHGYRGYTFIAHNARG